MNAPAADPGQLRIACLQSRRLDDTIRLIERHGGIAYVSPSMREVPIEPNRAAVDFAYQVITGQISVVVLMTGVGFRFLMSQIQGDVDRQRFLDALSDITTIARGPKPAAAMKEVGLTPTHRVPSPNTWRELLQLIDRDVPVSNLTVGLQEYGISNPSLIAGLEARGAQVQTVRVYGWEFPEDTEPLQANIRAILDGQRDVLMFTSAHQVVNLLRMADSMGVVEPLRHALRSTVIASIGPTTSDALQEHDFPVDIEPQHPKLGHLMAETARSAPALVRLKLAAAAAVAASPSPSLLTVDNVNLSPPANQHPSNSSLFMRACRGEATERTPVWMMRQAGRYMAEYRSVRSQQSFLELCKSPRLCSEVMCTAVDRLGVDAAIIFSDILPILEPLGFDLDYVQGDGPVIGNPLRSGEDLKRLRPLDNPQDLGFVYETVRQTRADLPEMIPVIGFSGAPFTLASYAIEGGSSRQYVHTKRLMYSEPAAWDDLMQTLTHAVIVYLNHQIAAGAQCVQLFDSWAGCLAPADYRRYVLPSMRAILAGITPGIPVINFATGNSELLPLLCGDARTVVGVDWRIPLDTAWQKIDYRHPVQGNLDPTVLLGGQPLIKEKTQEVLDAAGGRPGHIFNVGHGILQQTPVENAIHLVELVKELSQR